MSPKQKLIDQTALQPLMECIDLLEKQLDEAHIQIMALQKSHKELEEKYTKPPLWEGTVGDLGILIEMIEDKAKIKLIDKS